MKSFSCLDKLIVALALVNAAGSMPVFAQEAPDILVQRISTEVLDAARHAGGEQAKKRDGVRKLVETKILPHTDFQRTTAMAVGRHWRDATPSQQKQLTDEFRNLLLHTYSGALFQVKDQKLEFGAFRAESGDTDVEVRSRVVQPRGEPIPLNYRLAKTGDGWKIYDVNILGAWLIETYKPSFAAEVDRGGIDGLIRTLAEKNRRLGASGSAS